MKKTALRFISLALALALPLLSGCTASHGDAVRYGDFGISRAIFQYQCCLDKTSYLYEANGTTAERTSASQLQDNAAIWAMEDADGNSVANALKQGVLDRLKWILYLEQYAASRGYTLTEDDKASVKNDLNKMVKNFETKSEFNKTMKNYGINYDQMYDFYLHQAQASLGNYLLFGEGGSMEITDDVAKSYFEKNYITVGCIFINNQNKTYPNGKTVVLPENEKVEKTRLAEEVYQKLLAGEDFATLYQRYSDRQDADSGTYTFTHGSFGNDRAEDAAFGLTVGKTAKVETDNGVFILIRRGLNNTYFEKEKETVVSALEEVKKQELLATADPFIVDQEYLDSISIADLVFVR